MKTPEALPTVNEHLQNCVNSAPFLTVVSGPVVGFMVHGKDEAGRDQTFALTSEDVTCAPDEYLVGLDTANPEDVKKLKTAFLIGMTKKVLLYQEEA